MENEKPGISKCATMQVCRNVIAEYATHNENRCAEDAERLPAEKLEWEAQNEPLTIELGQGKIEIGQGHHGAARLPAILFGRNGAGAVGVETEGDRFMEPGECIAAITFENPESLDVVAEKLAELRARIWPDASPAAPAVDAAELGKLKALAEAATPGPWLYRPMTETEDPEIGAANGSRVAALVAADMTKANSAYIAAANPAAILRIAALVAQQAARIEELEQQAPDFEAIGWAYTKLLAFGCGANNLDSAMMLDRLNLMLLEGK